MSAMRDTEHRLLRRSMRSASSAVVASPVLASPEAFDRIRTSTIRTILAFALSVTMGACVAGELIRDATVAEVASTYGGADFAVKLSGGTGICAGVAWIVFPEAKAKSATSNKQAIATALLAFSTGKKLRVHNYEDDSCAGANFVSISN